MYIVIRNSHRRTFRSQTSDLWTDAAAVVGRVREERVSRKTIKVREKVEQSRNTVFSPQFCGSRGSKSRLRKATVQSCLIGWEIKNCTYHFCRMSCRIASFLMLSTSNSVEVSQNLFVCTSILWGGLAELLGIGPVNFVNFHFFFEVSHNCFLSDRYCR